MQENFAVSNCIENPENSVAGQRSKVIKLTNGIEITNNNIFTIIYIVSNYISFYHLNRITKENFYKSNEALMKTMINILVILLLCIQKVTAQSPDDGEETQSGEYLYWQIISNAGTSLEGEKYTVKGSVGQPVVGLSTGNKFIVNHGFWYSGIENNLSAEFLSEAGSGLEITPNIIDNGILNITVDAEGTYNIEVYNSNGHIILKQIAQLSSCQKYKISLNEPAVPNGVYFIRLSSNKNSYLSKFIIIG